MNKKTSVKTLEGQDFTPPENRLKKDAPKWLTNILIDDQNNGPVVNKSIPLSTTTTEDKRVVGKRRRHDTMEVIDRSVHLSGKRERILSQGGHQTRKKI